MAKLTRPERPAHLRRGDATEDDPVLDALGYFDMGYRLRLARQFELRRAGKGPGGWLDHFLAGCGYTSPWRPQTEAERVALEAERARFRALPRTKKPSTKKGATR